MKFQSALLAASAIALLIAAPAHPETFGTKAGALNALKQSQKNHQHIIYFDSMDLAMPTLVEKANVYEGLMLDGSAGDFMKDEPLTVIRKGIARRGDGTALVVEQVVYPVWSAMNKQHVLRSAIVSRMVSISPSGVYTGLDGKKHRTPQLAGRQVEI
jgi:hypothetical protein